MSPLIPIVLSNLVLAALLAVIAFALTRVWKNQHVVHVLWVIVLAKLITPPLWHVPVPGAEMGTPAIVAPKSMAESAGGPEGQGNIGPGAQAFEAIATETIDLTMPDVENLSNSPSGVIPNSSIANRSHQTWNSVPIITLSDAFSTLVWVWVASSVLAALVVIIRVQRFHCVARRGECADRLLIERVSRIADRIGLRNLPDVRLLEANISPMVWPLTWRKMLLLPRRLVKELTPEQLDTVIAHELAHLVRRDELVRLLESVVTCLFWWNPVVWFARNELRAAEEDCCDALVVCSLPESRKQYGEALLRAAELITFGRSLPALASAFGQQRFLKRRIEMILKHKFHRSASWQAKLTLLILALTVLPLAATAMSQAPAVATPDGANPGVTLNTPGEVTIDLLGTGEADDASTRLDPAGHATAENGAGINPVGSAIFPADSNLAQAGISPSNSAPMAPMGRSAPMGSAPMGSAPMDRSAPMGLMDRAESPNRIWNARETAEAFLKAGMSGDAQAAMRFTGPRAIQEKDVMKLAAGFKTPEAGVKLIDVVHAQEREDSGNAIAITNSLTLSKPKPDGPKDGRLVLQLMKIKDRWFVTDIDLATEETAEKDLKDFLEHFPKAQQVHSEVEKVNQIRLLPPEFKSGWEVYEFGLDTPQLDKLRKFRDWMNVTPQANRTRVEVEVSRRNIPLKKIELNPTLDGYPTGPVREAALPLKNGEVSDLIPYGKIVLLVRRIGETSDGTRLTNPGGGGAARGAMPSTSKSGDISARESQLTRPTNAEPMTRAAGGVPVIQNTPDVGRLFTQGFDAEEGTTINLLDEDADVVPDMTYEVLRFRQQTGKPGPSVWGQQKDKIDTFREWLTRNLQATPREIGKQLNEMGAAFGSVNVTTHVRLDQIKNETIRGSAAELQRGKFQILFLSGEMVVIRQASRNQTQRGRAEGSSGLNAIFPESDRLGVVFPAATIHGMRELNPVQRQLIAKFVAAQSPTLTVEEREKARESFRREWVAKGFEVTPALEQFLQQDFTPAHASGRPAPVWPRPVDPDAQRPLGVLKGKLIDGTGKPMARQPIWIVGHRGGEYVLFQDGPTGADGSFEFVDMPSSEKWRVFIPRGNGPDGYTSNEMTLPDSRLLEIVASFDGRRITIQATHSEDTPADSPERATSRPKTSEATQTANDLTSDLQLSGTWSLERITTYGAREAGSSQIIKDDFDFFLWRFDAVNQLVESEIKPKDGKSTLGGQRFSVDRAANPKQLTLTNPKSATHAIYEIDGDTLRIGAFLRSTEERPASFETRLSKNNRPLMVFAFRRELQQQDDSTAGSPESKL